MGLTDLSPFEIFKIREDLGSSRRVTISDLLAWNTLEREHFKARLEADFVAFCDWVYPLIRGENFVWAMPQECVYTALHGVETGRTKRLIINAPPRFGKSEIVEILWPVWHMLKNPRSCWLVICASDDLVKMNSATARDILGLNEVILLWPHSRVSPHTKDKSLWMTKAGGYYRAVSVGGQITGFGAGKLGAEYFAGALILADMLKAQDIRSIVRMEALNGTYTTTLKNRVNDKRTPIIVEAQRLDDADLPGFLLAGGSGEKWHHARIPAVVLEAEEENAKARYKRDWSFGIPLDFGLEAGFTWPEKYSEAEDAAERLDEESWSSQRIQNPRKTKGTFFRASWFRRYERAEVMGGLHGNIVINGNERIPIESMEIFADTAQKTKEANDYSVFQLWAKAGGDIFLIDQIRGKWGAPQLRDVSSRWLEKYQDVLPRRYGWRRINIEDKSSGTGLIQELQPIWGARVNPIPRSTDKVSRALGVVLPLEAGRVHIPRTAAWIPEYIAEFVAFSKDMTHVHDDQVDPTIDAIVYMLGSPAGSIYDNIS